MRIRLQMANRVRDLALFDLGLDSKLRGCDLVKLRLSDVTIRHCIRSRCMVVQQKTGRPVVMIGLDPGNYDAQLEAHESCSDL